MAGVKGMHWRASTSATYAEAVRARIRAGGIAKRLEQHVLGKVEMTASQVSAALGLLRKVVPDQQYVEHTGKDGGPIETTHLSREEVARRYAFLLSRAAIGKAQKTSKEPA
jgi:hypothetical protein